MYSRGSNIILNHTLQLCSPTFQSMKILCIINRIPMPSNHVFLLAFLCPHWQHLLALILMIPISICSLNHENTVNIILTIFFDNFVRQLLILTHHVNFCCGCVSSSLGIQYTHTHTHTHAREYTSFASDILSLLLSPFIPPLSIEIT
jgi:hypothetical protein